MIQNNKLSQLREIVFGSLTNPQRVTEYWKNIFTEDPFLTNVFMTIELVFGDGNTIRLATDDISVTKNNNESIGYLPFLQNEPEISVSYNLGSGNATQRKINLELDGRMIDCLEILNNGTIIAGVGEISLQVKNGIYENRLILMIGDMVGGIVFGTKDEIISLDITDPIKNNDFTIPPNSFFITKSDFPEMADEELGQKFPVVVGSFQAGVPCIRTTSYRYGPSFIVAYGHSVNVTSVFINDKEISKSDAERGWEINEQITNSGIPYTQIQFVFPASADVDVPWFLEGTMAERFGDPNIDAGETYYGRWPEGSVSVFAKVISGNVENSGSRPVLDCMLELIQNYSGYNSETIDWQIFSKTQIKSANILADILINGSDNKNSTTVIEYISSMLNDSFPMINLIYSNLGIGAVLTDRRTNLVIASLNARNGDLIDRISSISETPTNDLKNKFILKYSYNTKNDNYEKMLMIDSSNNYFCKISQDTIGLREHDLIESIFITDDRTALYVLSWLAAHYSLPKYTVEYILTPKMYLILNVGDTVKITDDELGWENQIATINKISYKRGIVTAIFDVWIIYNKLEKIQ